MVVGHIGGNGYGGVVAHLLTERGRTNLGRYQGLLAQNKVEFLGQQMRASHIDAAAVYVNASTRFTDGGEFGFGAEIGISTQKLHARGPMGLEQLTTVKYIVEGEGQVR